MIPIWLAHVTLAPPVEGSGSSMCVACMCVPFAVFISQSYHTNTIFCAFVCQCVLVCSCVHVCGVILWLCCCSLMTRAVPGSWGCHSVVTNSLGRLAAAKVPAPAKPPCTPHSNTHSHTDTHQCVSCCLDSSKCVYVAVDGCFKTLL